MCNETDPITTIVGVLMWVALVWWIRGKWKKAKGKLREVRREWDEKSKVLVAQARADNPPPVPATVPSSAPLDDILGTDPHLEGPGHEDHNDMVDGTHDPE